MRDVELNTESAEATKKLGETLGRVLLDSPSDRPVVIYLSGELGAGKTTFASGLLRAMGVSGAVRSPTYTLIEPYELAYRSLYHLDLYRLSDVRELEMLALRDLLRHDAILLIEWAERGKGALPPPDLRFALRYPEPVSEQHGLAEGHRALIASATTREGELLLDKLLGHVC